MGNKLVGETRDSIIDETFLRGVDTKAVISKTNPSIPSSGAMNLFCCPIESSKFVLVMTTF
jgi:hypothetical protein